ncbi:hypothetical protein GMOD_00003717 [Pyrenophora seminiperda CCB06]|uniref:Uncharacterized protein n=1 Tax=Pyrenophora seminiperda CCB06 TaxID=1302712 RepID=A0A3M7MJN1_9PLEO|nr:hypothetical protein GMOD_00003717 [Pyrenophora seminiperda CCB06]
MRYPSIFITLSYHIGSALKAFQEATIYHLRLSQHEPPTVHECSLSWCVHRMQSSYMWVVYSEDIRSTYLAVAVACERRRLSVFRGSGFSNSRTTYFVWNKTAYSMAGIWDDFFLFIFIQIITRLQPLFYGSKTYFDGSWTRSLEFSPCLAPG